MAHFAGVVASASAKSSAVGVGRLVIVTVAGIR